MMRAGRLLLRTSVGGLMIGHGLQRFTDPSGGADREAATMSAARAGPPHGRVGTAAAGLAETVGGGLTVAGLFDPLGPAMVIGAVTVAVRRVEHPDGRWTRNRAFEHCLTLIAASFAIAADGPGVLSVDALRGRRRSGFGWGVAALVLGAGAAVGVLAATDRRVAYDDPGPESFDEAPDILTVDRPVVLHRA